jgi:signal transduction histidine kinase
MIVRDDGCGFDSSAPHGGIGLASMRERAEGFGGSFTVESASGQGTQIVVTLPLAE